MCVNAFRLIQLNTLFRENLALSGLPLRLAFSAHFTHMAIRACSQMIRKNFHRR
jgi:hypothetical protein